MIVTVTERATFKRCRRRWDYESLNRQRLCRLVPSPALGLGSLIHEALASWLVEPEADLNVLFNDLSIAKLAGVEQQFTTQLGRAPTDMEMSPLYEAVGLGMRIMANYQAQWKTPLPEGFELVATEQQVHVAIPDTTHFLEAKLDGIIRNASGRLFVLEHKTFSQQPQLQHLQMNDQFLAYIWALKQLNIGKVGGLVYDGIAKREAPPKGQSFDVLFPRYFFARPEAELAEFETFLAWEAIEMANNPPLYTHRAWWGCWDCDFEPLCAATSRDEDTEYIMRTQYTHREETDNARGRDGYD